MTNDNKHEKVVKEYMERVESGTPIMRFLIEPPFKINPGESVIPLDAPCFATRGKSRQHYSE